jgi:TonB family protein
MPKISRILFFVLLLSSLSGLCFSQPSAPLKWEQYSVPEKNVTVSFPKRPVFIPDRSLRCSGQYAEKYGIYSGGAVYVFSVIYKVSPPNECTTRKEFSAKNFTARLASSAESEKLPVDKASKRAGLNVVKFRQGIYIIQLYNDPKNDRWFELWVVDGDESKPEVNAFLNSLVIEKKTTGINLKENAGEIANKAATPPVEKLVEPVKPPPAVVFGPTDRGASGNGVGLGVGNSGSGAGSGDGVGGVSGVGSGPGGGPAGTPNSSSKPADARPLVIVLKQTPLYTEMAKEKMVNGTVRLKVTFSANGTIGSVTPVNSLGYGLTEQAIAAARKIVFVPAKRNGVPFTVAKVVEYNFNLF